MSNAIVEVSTTVRNGDPPKDLSINVLHFSGPGGTAAPADWQNLADQVKTAFYAGGSLPHWIKYYGRGGSVKVYDAADAKPRPEKAFSNYTPTSWESAPLGPRQIACCLSFYASRNLKNTRGRIYLGPFNLSDVQETAQTPVTSAVLDLGSKLYNIATTGAYTWNHCVYSRVTGLWPLVTNYWVNDRWDVQRGRGHAETFRAKFP